MYLRVGWRVISVSLQMTLMIKPQQHDPRRIGMITPSSNTVLEPCTGRILQVFGEDVSVHVARLRVTQITLDEQSQQQFDLEPFLDAAERLAEAHVHLIVWNGTSASWLGIDRDRLLCEAIESRTGIKATTTLLAYEHALMTLQAKRLILVTPYLQAVQVRIIDQFQASGYSVLAERHLDDVGNYSFAAYTPDTIFDLVIDASVEVANHKPSVVHKLGSTPSADAILILCTNFYGAPIANRVEQRLGITVLDSVSVTAWFSLLCVGLNTDRVRGWGQLFSHTVHPTES